MGQRLVPARFWPRNRTRSCEGPPPQGFGDRRHDRVIAFAIPVVAHLFEEIAPLLPPNDRDGIGVGGHAILAVTGRAELRLGLDVVGSRRRAEQQPQDQSQHRKALGNRRVPMALLLPTCVRTVPTLHEYPEIGTSEQSDRKGAQRVPLPANKSRRKARIGLESPPSRVTDAAPAACPWNQSPVEASFKSANVHRMETMRSKLMLTVTASAAALLFTLKGQPVLAQDEPAILAPSALKLKEIWKGRRHCGTARFNRPGERDNGRARTLRLSAESARSQANTQSLSAR